MSDVSIEKTRDNDAGLADLRAHNHRTYTDFVGLLFLLGSLWLADYNTNVLSDIWNSFRDDIGDHGGGIIILTFIAAWALLVLFVRRFVDIAQEMKARQAAEEMARHLAMHDPITGMPNRRQFNQSLAIELARAEREKQMVAVLSIGLERFKAIADVHGQPGEDAALAEIVKRIRSQIRVSELVARVDRDCFMIAISYGEREDAPVRLASRLSHALGISIDLDTAQAEVGSSIGIAVFPSDGTDAEALMRKADVAMHRSRAENRGNHHFFEQDMDDQLKRRAELESALRLAICEGEIKPHYQPLVELSSGKLTGFEVLARWEHPTQGNIPPVHFIPIAEDTGLISDLTLVILRQACRDALTWDEPHTIAINVSPHDLVDRDIASNILTVLQEEGLPPNRLEIELTENALVADIDAALSAVTALKSTGVKVALDDFGTGYSSLYHLRKLPFDKIKIDKSFIDLMREEGQDSRFVNAILNLGRNLGVTTTAEGIETADCAAHLKDLGCNTGQGYVYSKPVPATMVDGAIANVKAMEPATVDAKVLHPSFSTPHVKAVARFAQVPRWRRPVSA